MRLTELTRRKKVVAPYDPVEREREMLEYYKEQGMTKMPNGTKQLFVPRKVESYHTKKEFSDYIFQNRAQYAYDDEGNLKPEYQRMIDLANESIMFEGAPILVNTTQNVGGQKPTNSALWTSTAKEKSNGKRTSSWNDFVQEGGLPDKMKGQGQLGYLNDVKPGTTVCEIDSTNDAKCMYEMFATLGRENTAYADPEEWKRIREIGFDSGYLLQKDFPWQHIARHFDCVHHYNFGRSSYDGFSDFTYGYDCESTAWFKSDHLTLLGKVPLWTAADMKQERDADD